MIHDWTVTRSTPNGQAVLGVLSPGSGAPCYSLERLAVIIPEGTYRVTLTESQRATRKSLWAPYDDHKLPELHDVPGRTAIRIHSGNCCTESAGCLLVGSERTPTEIHESHAALTRLVNELRAAERNDDQVWLTIRSGA